MVEEVGNPQRKTAEIRFEIHKQEFIEFEKMAAFMHSEGLIRRNSVHVLAKAALKKSYNECNDVLTQAQEQQHARY